MNSNQSFLRLGSQKKGSQKKAAGFSLLKRVFALTFLINILFSGYVVANESKVQESVASKEAGADIRMLIDISGSMKKNDPANLRIPAVNLLTELIPDGDEAGVWTFGQWVNNLIKLKAVDDQWREDAKEKAKKINSVALYTNIGEVLEKSSDDFYRKDKDFSNTHFILLTDGMVDIDKDPEKNATERERILTSVLETFRGKGAKIHSISLSKNADKSLMDKLAIQTGGQSAVAESPEDLTRIFLQALEQAVPSEQVPIEGNEFVIDSSVEEFTALIFRGDGDIPTEILSPDETVYTYESQGEDIKWYQDKGYDLITITRPLEGTWKIKSDVQPGSQVTVVSNLQLNVTKLPVNFFAGDPLDVEVSFSEEGKTVTSPDFLNLLDVDLQIKTESNKTAKKSMSDSDDAPSDGIFRESIRKLSKVGQYEVTVLVDGKTFKRKKRQIINLRAPFDFEFSTKGEGDDAHYALVVTPMSETISLSDTNIFAKVNAPDGSSLINALELDADGKRWVLPIKPDKGDGLYKVAVKVKAKTSEGKSFKFKPKPFEAEFPIPAGAANSIVSVNEQEEPPAELPEDVVEPEKVEEPKEEAPVEEPEPEKEEPKELVVEETEGEIAAEEVDLESEDDMMKWLMIGGGALAGLLLIGGLAFYFLKKRKANDDQEEEIEEVLSDQDVEEISEDVEAEAPAEEDEIAELNESLDFVEEPPEEEAPEDVPVVSQEPDEEDDEPLADLDDEDDEPLVELEEEEEISEVEDLADPEEEVSADEPDDLIGEIPDLDVSDDVLDQIEESLDEPPAELSEEPSPEEPALDVTNIVESEPEDLEDIVDLSTDDLSDVAEELDISEPEDIADLDIADLDVAADDEDLAADIAQAIEDAADEPMEDLDQEIEDALDINDAFDDDDDDEEFNLEDFDIGDTDDLPTDDKD
jgi:uncharacterized protein (TIGR03503 family)